MGTHLSPFRPAVLTGMDAGYPEGLHRCLRASERPALAIIGETSLLSESLLGLICSVHCPGSIVLQTYDLFQRLKLGRRTVIGGFHSPMEKECLRILLSGRSPVIICPARTIDRMRIGADLRSFVASGRLSVVSPFSGSQRRPTARLAEERNRFVANLAEEVLIPFAAHKSKTERLAREILGLKKKVITFPDGENESLICIGASPLL